MDSLGPAHCPRIWCLCSFGVHGLMLKSFSLFVEILELFNYQNVAQAGLDLS